MNEEIEEGVRAILHEDEVAVEKQQPSSRSLKIDKKKLVVYSELMKPKFDDVDF